MTSNGQIADVSRPLHSVSKICDGDKEMLFMKGEAGVVAVGTFSRLLASIMPLVRCKRFDGLYGAKMRATAKSASGCTRPGPGR